jgi:hypothetical protein
VVHATGRPRAGTQCSKRKGLVKLQTRIKNEKDRMVETKSLFCARNAHWLASTESTEPVFPIWLNFRRIVLLPCPLHNKVHSRAGPSENGGVSTARSCTSDKPRLVFPTPQPLFSPEQNSRPETIRSTSIAGARSTRSETFARFSTKRPALPSLAVAASRSKDAGISPASLASEPRRFQLNRGQFHYFRIVLVIRISSSSALI